MAKHCQRSVAYQFMFFCLSAPGSMVADGRPQPAFPAGFSAPKAAPDGGAEAADSAPGRVRDSALGRLGLWLQTTAALRAAMLRRSVLKGLSLAEIVRASHLAHTELSAKRSVVGDP